MNALPAEPRWHLRDPDAAARALPRLPRVVATVLAARGLTDRAAVDDFYQPRSLAAADPMKLPDIHAAMARVRSAIDNGELIALYGDFDVDGVTSIAVLSTGLEPLGAHVLRYIPDRYAEGYGLNTGAIDKLAKQGVSLIITADCGISSVIEVDHANALGVDVIILDHHTVPAVLPRAVAAVNPKRPGNEYAFEELAAVGVSYEFLRALYDDMGRDFAGDSVIDLVALGTVADVAPLAMENRRLVVEGIQRMQATPRPGIVALAAVAGIETASISAENFGFALGPRLNAAGRLAHAQLALDLVLAPDIATARPLAEELQRLNRERRQMTEDACALADELLDGRDDPLIMVGHADIRAGIVGLVASRLAEAWHRPAIVYQEMADGTSRASARSIRQFDVVRAIRKEQDLLIRHGGHRAAAGFTVPTADVPELRQRLINTAAELLDEEDLCKEIVVDAEAELHELTGVEIRGLMQFEPCGHGNERPVLLSRGVEVVSHRTMGAGDAHLTMQVRSGGYTWRAVAWRQAEAELAPEMDIVYNLKDGWRGRGVELEILDMAPSARRKPLHAAAAKEGVR